MNYRIQADKIILLHVLTENEGNQPRTNREGTLFVF